MASLLQETGAGTRSLGSTLTERGTDRGKVSKVGDILCLGITSDKGTYPIM